MRSKYQRATIIAQFAIIVLLVHVHQSDSLRCFEYAHCLGAIVRKGSAVDGEHCCNTLGGGAYLKSNGKCKTCPGAVAPEFAWSSWTDWKTCCYEQAYDVRYSEKIQGQKTRSRDCLFGKCQGKDTESATVKKCVPDTGNGDSSGFGFCPIHGQWGEWGEWGRCDAHLKCSPNGTVAKGQKDVHGLETRTRECNNPAPRHGGAGCEGINEVTQHCKVVHCPVNGGYCPWKEWSVCTKNCTVYGSLPDGSRSRRRSCACPLPAHRGRPCIGPSKENGVCGDEVYCPLDGKWSPWSEWTECDRPCGIGERWRRRTCSPPQFGGKLCSGLSREYELCQLTECPSICQALIGSGYSGSSSGFQYSGSGDYEADYNICCPPTYVYAPEYSECCRLKIDILPSGSGSTSGSGVNDSKSEQPTSSSASGSAEGSVGSSSGWDPDSSTSGSGSSVDDLYYDCISADGGSGGSGENDSDPSASGSVSGEGERRRRRSSIEHRRRHRRRHHKSRKEDYVYYDMEHGDYE